MLIIYEYAGNDELVEQLTTQSANELLATAFDVAAANETTLEQVSLRFVQGELPEDDDIGLSAEATPEPELVLI